MNILTKDLFEASFLLAKGMRLEGVLRNNRTVLFRFEGTEDLEVLKSKYQEGRAEVNVRILKNSLNHLRDIVFEKIPARQEYFSSH
jgi:hypothetical protein